MSRYRKEIDMLTKALDLNGNNPMSYEDLRKVLFNVKDNVFLNILSDMFAEGSLTATNNMYQLPPILYAEKIEKANKKRQAIIDTNNRLSKIRSVFIETYYKLEDAKKTYISALKDKSLENFETDMKSIGYTVSNNYLISKFASIGEYLSCELLKLDIIDTNQFISKYEDLCKNLEFNYLLDKLKQQYKIIEFEKGAYINIKKLNQMGIYLADIKAYCSEVYKFRDDGKCFSIKTLRDDGFCHKLDDLGMDDIFYENLLKYNNQFFFYKMSNGYVFSTGKKPSVAIIVFEILKDVRMISIYDLQDILRKQYGVTSSIISDGGSLVNQSLIFEENTNLFYSKEFEKIYFDKEDFYEEVEYDE